MAIPVLNLGPDPRDRGRVHGDALRADIAHNVETYITRFEKLGHKKAAVLAEAGTWISHFDRLDPEFGIEIKGVAEGSGRSLPEIALLNVRYELIIGMMKRQGAAASGGADGCTSFAIMPERTKNGDTIIGQNWDWVPDVKTFVARVEREDKPNFICLGETGTVGGMQGVNEHGVGVVINALMSTSDATYNYEKPFRMRVRDVLNARNMHSAIAAISSSNRVVSMNFLIGHADGEAIDIEAGPDREAYIYPSEGILTHSNHFCKLPIDSEVTRVWPNTMYRNVRLERLLRHSQQLDSQGIQNLMSDHFSHPHSICAHVDDEEPEPMRLETRASVLISLGARTLAVTDGPPCSNKYERHQLVS
jgi:isopenicillin-N N-acyltransferase-like protein